MHTYRPRMRRRADGEWNTKDWFKWKNSSKKFDSTFDPMILLVMAAVDIGIAMRDTVCCIANPDERALKKEELMRDLRRVRRPFYYEQEVAHRRELAKERRKIRRRSTTAPMPNPTEILDAWNARKSSRRAMILLGGMLSSGPIIPPILLLVLSSKTPKSAMGAIPDEPIEAEFTE